MATEVINFEVRKHAAMQQMARAALQVSRIRLFVCWRSQLALASRKELKQFDSQQADSKQN